MHTSTLFTAVALLLSAGVAVDELPPPEHEVSLVCFNGEDGCRSNCRTTITRRAEEKLKVLRGSLTCGFKGGVISKITWTCRGREGGKDIYRFEREASSAEGTEKTQVDVAFDGKRLVLFRDDSQCIVIERKP